MQTAPVPSEDRHDMPHEESQRGTAVGQKAHQRPKGPDGTAAPVVDDPQAHNELPRRSTDKSPAQNKIGPPQRDPQAEDAGGVTEPSRISRRFTEQIKNRASTGKIAQQRQKEQKTETAVDQHIEKTGDDPAQRRGRRHSGPAAGCRSLIP